MVHGVKSLIYPLDYQEIVVEYAQDNNLEPAFIMAMIKVESNYVEDAHSGKASGLMQLTDETGDWVAAKLGMDVEETDLMNPDDNIRLGCYYIRYLIDYYGGEVDVALAAYNGGMGNVNRWLSDKRYSEDGETLSHIPFKETSDYVKKVNRETERYKKLLEEESLAKRFK
ncbi:MAG: lytic transglycosylase domain-containing protein [Clostridia bacterium]|nr:lytic transglycosylase domain-containing protein [Clostridia bacterium]